MELKGNLDSQSLQEIFTALAQNKQIGTLIVSDGESKKYIYFARAGIRLLSSGKRKNIRLGDLLVKQNKITPDQLQAVLARQEETGEMVGKILTDWGLVTEAEIDEAVSSQIEEEIFDLFTWDNATFKFTEGAPPKELFDPNQRATRLTFDVNQLIQKAARYVDEMARAKDMLPPVDTVYHLGEFTELEFYERDDSDPVKRIVKAIDGFRTVADVVVTSGLNQLQAAEIIGTLLRDKKIEKVESPVSPGVPGRELSDFVTKCERELETEPGNIALRERLAQAYFDLGEASKTVYHLSVVVNEVMKAGRLEEAMATARRIAEIAPDDLGNQERILRIHFELRDTDGVLTTAASLAELYWEAGDKERVKNMYKLVLELVPEDIEIRKKLINLYLDANDRDGAADEYEAIAGIMERRGNTAGLYEIYQKISRLAPHRKDLLRRLKGRSDKPVVRIPRSPFHFFKRLLKWVFVLAVLGGIGGAVWWELQARRDAKPLFEEAERLRTEGEYDEAEKTLDQIETRHPYTLLRYLDLPGRREEVAKSKVEEQQRIDKEVNEAKAKRRKRWEEIEAGEIEIRRNNTGELLLEKLAILKKEIEAFLAIGEDDEFTKKAAAWLEARKARIEEAEALLREAKDFEIKDRRLAEGRKKRKKLQKEYEDTPAAQNVLMPFQILSVPSGATVLENGKRRGKTPCLLYADLEGARRRRMFKIRLDGYFPTELELDRDQIDDRTDFEVDLTRKPLWTLGTGEAIEAPPAVLGPMVYTGSRDGFLYAVDTRRVDPQKPGTWRAAWRYKHPDPRRVGLGGIVHAPVAVEDLVIYGHTDSYLYAVRNGAEVWSYSLGPGNTIIGSPLVADKRVVIGVGAGRKGFITCFPLSPSGAQQPWWQFPAGGRKVISRLSVPPILDAAAPRKRIYLATAKGMIYGLDLLNGYMVAKFDLRETVACPMAIQDGVLYVVTQDWVVRAVDFTSERAPFVRWTFTVGKPVKAGLLIHSGRLVVCTEWEKGKGQVIVLDTRDRAKAEVKWDFKTKGLILATPVVDRNRLYIGSYDRNIYALFFWEGKRAWSFAAQGRINGLVVREGIIYATTKEGDLFAVKSE